MSLHRRAAKRDANEPAIVSALEAHGCVVWRVSGKGLPDLVVFHRRKSPVMGGPNQKIFVADVKGPKEKATQAQEEKWGALSALGFAVFILRTPEDAQKMLNNALQPWESERLTPLPNGGHLRSPPRTGSKAGRADYVEFVPPRNGDAAKAPGGTCARCGHKKEAHGRRGCTRTHPRTGTCGCSGEAPSNGDAVKAREESTIRTRLGPTVRKPNPHYTPPRSEPVDAAKEAEATFAPKADLCPRCRSPRHTLCV